MCVSHTSSQKTDVGWKKYLKRDELLNNLQEDRIPEGNGPEKDRLSIFTGKWKKNACSNPEWKILNCWR